MLVYQKYWGLSRLSTATVGNSTFSNIPSIAATLILITLIYLDMPQYMNTVDPTWLPKYWYYFFIAVSLPCILIALSGRGVFLTYPFNQWAVVMVLLMSGHLLLAFYDGEIERANIIQTNIQYIALGAFLGVAFSTVPQRYYVYMFPILSIAITASIVFDFINPGKFYSYTHPNAVLGRGAGTLINPNRAGEALIITLLFSICFSEGRNLLLLLMVCGIGVLLTFSRAAIMAWILLWFFSLYWKKVPSYTYAVVAALIVAVPSVVAIVTTYVLSSSEFSGAAANIFERLDFFGKFSLGDQSAQGRSEVLWAGINAFLEHPFFGAGSASTYVWVNGSTHNETVMLAAEYGVLGLAL